MGENIQMEVRAIAEKYAEARRVTPNPNLEMMSQISLEIVKEFSKVEELEVTMFTPNPNEQFGVTVNIVTLTDYQKSDNIVKMGLEIKLRNSQTDIFQGISESFSLLTILTYVMDVVKNRIAFSYTPTTNFKNFNETITTIDITKTATYE